MTTFSFDVEIDEGPAEIAGRTQVRCVVVLAGQQLWSTWVHLHAGPGAEEEAREEAMFLYAGHLVRAIEDTHNHYEDH
jgi:hypothetical protein